MDFFGSGLKKTLSGAGLWPDWIDNALRPAHGQTHGKTHGQTQGQAYGNRLQMSAVSSVIFHIAIILGVGFTFHINQTRFDDFSALQITLVDQFTEEAPENAKTLAQANLNAGGADDDRTRNPSGPVAALLAPDTIVLDQLMTPRSRAGLNQAQELLHTDADQAETLSSQIVQEKFIEEGGENLEMQVSRSPQSRLPDDGAYERQGEREEFITGQTREFHYAQYMERWRKVVEYIGNLYYPEQAKRDRLSGDLVLDVAIRRSGVVQDVRVLRSSGYKLLDDAAVRIVKLAAPFQPFSQSFSNDIDILHITRTWEFSGEAHTLTTQ